MADASDELKGGFFGYRKDDVRALLAARERMFLEVSDQARAAEERLDTTRSELDLAKAGVRALREQLDARTNELGSAQARVAELETQVAAATSEVAEHSQRAREGEQRLQTRESALREQISRLEAELAEARATPPPGVGELTAVLDATRDAIERIIAGARRSAEDQLAQVERTRGDLQAEIERASAWREHVSPLIDDVRREIGRTRAQALQVSGRVSEALRPMTDALTTLAHNLEDLERAAVTEAPERATSPDRVDLASHEGTEAREPDGTAEQRGADQRGAEQPGSIPHETPAWRAGGEGWR